MGLSLSIHLKGISDYKRGQNISYPKAFSKQKSVDVKDFASRDEGEDDLAGVKVASSCRERITGWTGGNWAVSRSTFSPIGTLFRTFPLSIPFWCF